MIPRIVQDILKVLLLLVLAGYLLYLADPANVVVFQAMGVVMFLTGGTHLVRRVMFNRLDMQLIANKAVADNNLAAAIVFASMCAVLIAILFVPMFVLK